MGRKSKTIQVEGLEPMRAKLLKPDVVTGPLKEMLTGAGDDAQKEIQRTIDGGEHKAVRSIFTDIRPLQARVGSMMDPSTIRSIDTGRKRGVEVAALFPGLIRWRYAVGYHGNDTKLAKGISSHGTKGKHFTDSSRDKVNATLPGRLQELMERLHNWWER